MRDRELTADEIELVSGGLTLLQVATATGVVSKLANAMHEMLGISSAAVFSAKSRRFE
jgi:hypothetical protein